MHAFFRHVVNSLAESDVFTITWVSVMLSAFFVGILLIPISAPKLGVGAKRIHTTSKESQAEPSFGGGGDISFGENAGWATYTLPSMSVTVGSKDQHLKFSAVLEYDKEALKQASAGSVRSGDDPATFFDLHKARIQDAIVLHASDLIDPQDTTFEKLESFRLGLVEAINQTLGREKEIVTSVYFNSFEAIPATG